jgi:branched-chain amino acid transport system substrate-binding protein
VQTVVGKLEYDDKGDVKHPAFAMYRWHDGKYGEIEQ